MNIDLRFRADAEDPSILQGERIQEVIHLLRSFVDEKVSDYLAAHPDHYVHPGLKVLHRAKSGDFISGEDLTVMQAFIQEVVDDAREAYAGKRDVFADAVMGNIHHAARIMNDYFQGIHDVSEKQFPLLQVH